MSMRFYRRVRLGKGAFLNIGKTGVSLSMGVRGAHITFGGAGGTRATVGIPGTGLFWSHNFTAAEKRRARYEAKQQRDAAYAAERQQRAFERERKKRAREQAIEQAVREKQMQLAALKSEFDEYQAYLTDLSNFHRIDMVYGEQAQSEFRSRCEPRSYKNVRFPFEDTAGSMSVYRYPGNTESGPDNKPIEDILCANNEAFRKATCNLTKLRNIEALKKKVEKDEKKLNIPALIFILGFVLIFFVIEVGLPVAIISSVAIKVLDIKYGTSKARKSIKLQLKSLGLTKKTFAGAVQSIESVINNELTFYADCKKELESVKFIVSVYGFLDTLLLIKPRCSRPLSGWPAPLTESCSRGVQ